MIDQFAVLIFVISLVFAGGRFNIPHQNPSWPGTYEAFAHIWVGMLIAFAIAKPQYRALAIIMLVIITIIEAVFFFYQR